MLGLLPPMFLRSSLVQCSGIGMTSWVLTAVFSLEPLRMLPPFRCWCLGSLTQCSSALCWAVHLENCIPILSWATCVRFCLFFVLSRVLAYSIQMGERDGAKTSITLTLILRFPLKSPYTITKRKGKSSTLKVGKDTLAP